MTIFAIAPSKFTLAITPNGLYKSIMNIIMVTVYIKLMNNIARLIKYRYKFITVLTTVAVCLESTDL